MTFMPRTPRHSGDRHLTRNEVKKRVNLSSTQIARLETSGEFPAQIKIGPRRIGWLESEITMWMQERIDARRSKEDTIVHSSDRFISETDVCHITSLSRPTLDRYVRSGLFPAPVRIGQGRKAWLEREVWQRCERRQL